MWIGMARSSPPSSPLAFPPLSSPTLPSRPLPFPPFPLEVGPLIAASGSGGAL